MADVQLEHGHVRIANALHEAIVYAPFTGTQMKIVHCVIRNTWGWHQRSARISRADIAASCHVAYSGGFDRQMDELIREGVILVVERGYGRIPSAYAIEKNFENWGKFSVAAKVLERYFGTRPAAASHPPQGGTKAPLPPPTGGSKGGSAESVVTPHRGVSYPPQGGTHTPYRGQQKSITPNENAELDPPKDIERQERQLTAAPRARAREDVIAEYAVGLTTAANNAIAEKWGDETRTRPLRWDQATQLASELIAREVPLELARTAIAECARASKLHRPPRAINYFSDAIDDAAAFEKQRRLDAEHPVPARVKRSRPPQRIAAVISADENAERARLEQLYNDERRAASIAWGKDPANKTRYHAIVAAANKKFADTISTSWGERARNADVVLECAKASGFPSLDEWLQQRSGSANGKRTPTIAQPAESP